MRTPEKIVRYIANIIRYLSQIYSYYVCLHLALWVRTKWALFAYLFGKILFPSILISLLRSTHFKAMVSFLNQKNTVIVFSLSKTLFNKPIKRFHN